MILYQVNGDGLSRLDRRLDGGDGIPHEWAVQLLVGGVDGSLRQAGGGILEQRFKSWMEPITVATTPSKVLDAAWDILAQWIKYLSLTSGQGSNPARYKYN